MRSLSTLIMGATLLIAAGMAGSADAQTPDPQPLQQPSRPYQGLFAASRVPTEQSLTFMATVGGGYDTNVLARVGGGGLGPGAGVTTLPPAGPAQASTFENGSASLFYSFDGRRISFDAKASTTANYYAALHAKPLTESDLGGLDTVWHATARTEVTERLAASYGPFYTLPGVPVVPVAPDDSGQSAPAAQTQGQTLELDNGSSLLVEDHLTVIGGLTLTHAVTRRLSFSLNYGDSMITSPTHAFDMSVQYYGGGFSYLLAQGLSARLFYTESTGRFGAGQTPTTSRGLNGGLAFDRTLSITRRTVLSFSSGLLAYSNAAILNGRADYFLSAEASVVREIGRTWTASVAYRRSASFDATLLQPIFSDALFAAVGGRLSRRVQVQSSIGGIDGTVGLFGKSGDRFRTYFASAGLRVDVSRITAVGLDYAYYRYRYASGVQLPLGFGSQSDVQNVRVYVSLWAPLMARGRIGDAAR